ncbi:phosphopantetheinyl transferase [Bradyrhizobium sp. GM0.4]
MAIAAAQAGLVMPAAGNPNDPRISIGVRIKPIAVDKASASKGVSASPTPRIIAVISRKTKPSGMVSSMMRA